VELIVPSFAETWRLAVPNNDLVADADKDSAFDSENNPGLAVAEGLTDFSN